MNRLAIYERNLLWSVRLRKAAEQAGYAVQVVDHASPVEAELAIVSLYDPDLSSEDLIAQLKAQGTLVIGHVGHKEKTEWEAGLGRGCDRVVSNSTLANRLAETLEGVLAAAQS